MLFSPHLFTDPLNPPRDASGTLRVHGLGTSNLSKTNILAVPRNGIEIYMGRTNLMTEN